ncbi:MAG TPA: MmgE/PrpD family protein, partial [Gammaproteobacteria bacterium]|nr:MmgE/PrpD family protein [Gammaproteobacteria bacterium]
GIAIRARKEAESTPALLAAVARMGMDSGTGNVFADGKGYAFPAAALINGSLIHSLDFDDTHIAATVHPTAPVLAAALAAGQMVSADGANVLAGVIAGYEVMCRLGRALKPADHYDRGFHPTATTGAFGATVAAGRALGLSPEQLSMALGICLSQSAGSMQFLVNSAWTKRFQVGNAAMVGVIAASLASEGFIGAADAVDGDAGFLKSYAPDPDPTLAVKGLGDFWETLEIGVKPYPSCRFSHAAIDGIVDIVGKGVNESQISEIAIGLPRKGMDLTALPEEFRRKPKGVVGGQFSMHFTAAVSAQTGNLTWDDYARYLDDPTTLSLAERIVVSEDPQMDAIYPERMGGKVTIQFRDGTSQNRCVEIPRGEPENFPAAGLHQSKFLSLAEPVLGDAAVGLHERLISFAQAETVNTLFG